MFNIVLVEPEIPQNTGNIARTAAVTASRLILVHPLGFSLDERHLRRAGLDYWDDLDLIEFPSKEAFFEAHGKDALHFLTSHAEKSFFDIDFGAEEGECYLVFGRESCGLGKEVIEANRQRCFRLPMVGGMRSLNLSNSVAITVYEYWRQLGFPSPFRASSS